MNKQTILTTLFALLIGAAGPWGSVTAQTKTEKTPMLNKIRRSSSKKYVEAREIMAKRRKTVRAYRYRDCIDCDVQYLAGLLESEKFTAKDYANLMCIKKSKCQDNAEFSQLYNEVVFMALEKKSEVFLECYADQRYANYKPAIELEIMSPVSDKINPKRVLRNVDRRLQRVNTQYKGRPELQQLQVKVERYTALRQQRIR